MPYISIIDSLTIAEKLKLKNYTVIRDYFVRFGSKKPSEVTTTDANMMIYLQYKSEFGEATVDEALSRIFYNIKLQ